jgi:hypothetical protein
MAYTPPNGLLYQSTLAPIATRTLTIKRGDGATAGGGTATTLGTYLVENCTFAPGGKAYRRMGTVGQGTDMGVIRDPWTFSGKVQIKNNSTSAGTGIPYLLPGDYFEEIVGNDKTGAAETTTHRFVITACPKDETAGSPHYFSITAEEDIENSPAYN